MIEYNDYELVMLYHEKNEDALNILFTNYQKLITFILNKYRNMLKNLGIDYQELYEECLLTFYESINNYSLTYNASFKTFSNMIIKRKINHVISKYNNIYKIPINNSVSLYDFFGDKELCEYIASKEKDPLNKIVEQENIFDLEQIIINNLSKNELIVYNLLVNNISYKEMMIILNKSYKQITNTIERIRKKIRIKLLEFYS